MNRDCGKGELKPYNWLMLSHNGKPDKESIQSITGPNDPAIQKLRDSLNPEVGSNVRVYVCDKQGYRNCILAYRWNKTWQLTTDRRAEL